MNDKPDKREPERGRKPYRAPAIEESGRFETLALDCTQFSDCTGSPRDPGTPSSD